MVINNRSRIIDWHTTKRYGCVVHSKRFRSKMTQIYEAWRRGDYGMGQFSSIFVAFSTRLPENSRTEEFKNWLFEFGCDDVLMLFTLQKVYIFCWYDEAFFFYGSVICKQSVGPVPPVEMIKCLESDRGVQKLFEIMESTGGNVGVFPEVYSEEPKRFSPKNNIFHDQWHQFFINSSRSKIDISLPFNYIFAVKDEYELDFTRYLGERSVYLWHLAKPIILDVVTNREQITHFDLGKRIHNHMRTAIPSFDRDKRVNSNLLPTICSGANFLAEIGQENRNTLIKLPGTIIVRIPTCYFDQRIIADITRTVLVDPSTLLKSYYRFVLKIQKTVIHALKPGKKLKDVYRTGIEFIREHLPDLLEHVEPNFGCSIGTSSLIENQFVINQENGEVVRAGMVFTVLISVQNIDVLNSLGNSTMSPVSFALSDVVIVSKKGENETVTKKAKSDLASVTIQSKTRKTHTFKSSFHKFIFCTK